MSAQCADTVPPVTALYSQTIHIYIYIYIDYSSVEGLTQSDGLPTFSESKDTELKLGGRYGIISTDRGPGEVSSEGVSSGSSRDEVFHSTAALKLWNSRGPLTDRNLSKKVQPMYER
jgi:hypothetical protein